MKTAVFKKFAFGAALALCFSLSAQAHEYVATPSAPSNTAALNIEAGRPVWGTQYDWLSNRRLTYRDVSGVSRWTCKIWKNSIYARYGRYFRTRAIANHFYRFRWYRPYRNEVSLGELSSIERYNVNFLLRYE